MITRKRLEELIEKGATIYSNEYGEIQLIKENGLSLYENGQNNYILYALEPNKKYHNEIFDEDLFETKEDADFALELQNITRTETLNLPTWEEIEYDKNGRFVYSFHIKNNYKFFGKLAIWKNIQLITIEGLVQGCQYELYFDEPLTKENYLEACKSVKKLCLGEKV